MYEPQDPIETIRTTFGSQSGHLEHLQITFWDLTFLTGDSPGLYFGQIWPKMVHYTYLPTCMSPKTELKQ